MNRKLLVSLLAVVAGLLVLLAVVELGDRKSSGSAGEYFLDGFASNANDVRRIELRFPAGKPGFSVRREDDVWLVDVRDDYPAEFSKLAKVVSSLADARIVERKTSNPDHYGLLGVDDPASGGSGTAVTLSGGGFSYDVIVGKQAQRTYRYARVAGAETSYLVDQDLDLDDSPDNWLVDDIVDIGADRIRRVTIRHADGETITIEKASPEDTNYSVRDVPAGRELSYASAGNGIAAALASLTFDEVRAEQEGEASATTTFETWDGLRIVASVVTTDDDTWLSFTAAAAPAEAAEGDETPATDPAAEASEINARLAGWQYRLADYRKNLFVRRWEDILKEEAGAEE